MIDLELSVHNCKKCHEQGLSKFLQYPPVYSFGDAAGKEIIIIGLNPSRAEYESGFLSKSLDVNIRSKSQLDYFRNRNYQFFIELEEFFGGQIKELLDWGNSPWEKVGYLDIVKCPTTCSGGKKQWSGLSRKIQRTLINNCKEFLEKQLELIQPKILITYGADVGRWFSEEFDLEYAPFEDFETVLNGKIVNILFIPQRQGPNSKPEVMWVRSKIAKLLAPATSKTIPRGT